MVKRKHLLLRLLFDKNFFTPALLIIFMVSVAIAFVIIRSKAITFTTVTVPNAITSDCSIDVQAPLSNWLAAQTNYTIVEFKPNGCYLVEDELPIANKSNFVIHGNNATIKRTIAGGTLPRTNHLHFHLTQDSYLTIQDLNIIGIKQDFEGYTVDREGQHGFGMWGVDHAVFNNVKISNVYGDCFYFNGGPQNGFSRFITIQNSLCHQSGRHGAAFLASSDILITHSTFENNHCENFDFEPYGTGRGGANNITIDSNTIGPASQLMVSMGGGSPEFKNFVFTNNFLHNRAFSIDIEGSGKPGFPLGPVTITGNTSDRANSGTAIQIHGVLHGVIAGNRGSTTGTNNKGEPNAYFVRLYGDHDFKIYNNIFSGAKDVVQTDVATDSSIVCEYNNLPSLHLYSQCETDDLWQAENGALGSPIPRRAPDATASKGQSVQFGPVY